MYYTSSEFLNSMASTSNMQAKPEVPKSNRMKRRSCEVPLAEVPNAFKISLNDISNISNYDTNSLKSFKTIVDGRLIRTYRPVYGDNRSFKSYRASISDFSNFDSISIPPPYDKQSRRSFNMESNDGHGMTSSIEGVLWSDEEENEYFYKEGITAAFNQDLAAIRQLLESETGSTTCPSCNMPFDKGKKRKLIDACGHERCYSCMFRNEICPLCVRAGQKTSPQKSNWESPSPQIRKMEQWENQNKMQKPPKPTTCPTPPNTRRRFFLSPKSLRSQFGQRGRITQENHVPLSDDEGGHVKTFESRRQSDLYMRLGLLLGEKKRGKSRDSCTSLASFDNTSPVSTLTGSSETDAVSPLGRDSLGSLASMSLSNYSVSSPGSRRHINGISMEKSKSEEFNRTASGFFKNRKTAARRSGRSSSKQSSASSTTKSAYSSQAINLRPLFFEVPSTDPQADFIGRHWLFNDITKILDSSSQGIVISGIQGTGKTALILQLVEYSCFGRKRCLEYEEVRETCEIRQLEPEDEARENFTKLAHSVVGYHFCQADNNSTCLVGEFVHSIAAQLCQSPRLQSYREHLINEPDLLSCLSLKECIADPGTAFTRGIIEPLVELRKNGQIDKSNNIILVDGLCEAEYHRPDHGYTIISFLVKHMSEIPSWFKIITTMRTELLELSKQLPFTRLSIDVCDNVQKDLFEYFNSRIRISPIVETNIRFTTGKNDSSVYKFAQYVIHLSRGSFLFLKLTLDLIEKSHIVIKSLNYKVVPISLAQIFLLQFNLKFPTVQSFEKVSHILSVCLAALYPLTLVEIYYSVNSLLVNKFLPWEEFCQRFEMLTDFLVKRIDNTYMFFHPSFREWLVRRDDGESIKFLCDLRAGHCGIAYRLSRVQAPLDSEKTLELGHHILKAHMYRNMSPTQLGLCPRDLQAALVASSSSNVGDSIANLRNIYTPNVKVSRLFLLAGGSPNHITSCLGEAPLLCIYSYQGILVMVGLLLEFGADLEGTNSQGCTAVSLACQRGHTDVVKRLIAAGASLTHPDTSGQTPLVHAAKNGHRDTMIYMIGYCQSNGIYDLDEIGAKHALMVAAQNGHLEIVEYLLDTAEISVLEECPRSKLCVTVAACMGGNTEVLEAVLWRGAKVCERSLNEAVRQSRPTRSTLLSKLLHGINEIPTLPVVLASAAGHDDAISMLLEYGGDPNSVDADGMSALGWACLRGHVSTVKLLLNRGASIEGCGSRAPLSLACGGDVALAEVLLSSGATLERVDHNGLRPLDRAVGLRNAPLVQFFLRRGAKLGPSTWVMASDKPDFMLILLNKLLEDGNTLYRKNHISEAAHRYQYALKKIASLIDDENRAQGLTQDQLPPFLQLKTNLLLNLSRCKRKINEPEEALELAEKACALRPDTFESSYARARALLQLSRPHEAAPYARRAVQLASPHHAPVAHDLLRRTLQFQH